MSFKLIVHLSDATGEEVNEVARELNERGWGITVYETIEQLQNIDHLQYCLLSPSVKGVKDE